ncbi:hypothetical protein GUITHDRAFT_119600 [Guillardia theta CCMP2712]|uniref:Uncharacterized protein n=1 Tax=Guillardia theta (strain CCMP2712) TaxID=905079 RepID=L1IDJ4_GUITC|nr:hypothetical protein GUITHDRAFT_119600 [Guillardia theta CCMP2712]EKX34182.1 hypothetical protein GUITHDRAFT_119600 [Guillardia theta CCMP2712]|eukprot:XP_005821162.1 hypothetical protein GUITHDRAFT_119600 [Guillardia theta CCMP2712]
MELGLMVDSVDGVDKAIMWKAPYRPEIARADDISVTVSFLRNEAAMELWEGRREYCIEGRAFRATEVSIAHDRSFKLRAKRGPWGKGGSLAELSQLLALGGMSTAEIAQIYRFQLLSQSLAAAEVQPLAGMLVQGPGQRGRKGPSPKTYVAVGASTGTLQQKELEWVLSSPSTASCEQTLASFRESEAMEGVHLTLISDDAKLAVELTADTFVPRGKIAKQRKALRERDHAGRSNFRVQIKSRSSMSTGRFSRKEMEALCGGGNTSITRVKRAMLELARRMNLKLVSVEVEEDRDTLSWDGSLIALSLATKAEARRLMEDMPFYLEGILEVKLEAMGFKLNPQHEEERSPSSEEQAQEPQGQQQGAGWLELSDIDRITMEAASPSGPVDQQVLLDLSTMLLETSEEELLAGKPISLELDKSVGKLHDTFCSPGNVEFMTLGAWAATPTLGSKRNILKEKLRAYLGEQRWTRVQGNKAARRGSAFSPRAAATDALEQEAESDDIESRSVSLLFLAISKFAEHHGLSCTGKVDKQDRLRLMMREEVDMEAEEDEAVEEEAGAGPSRA